MTKHFLTYLLILFTLVSCGKEESTAYSIKGKTGNGECRIVLFGLDNRFEKVDFITTNKEGAFTYTIDKDTIIPFSLFMPDGEQITLFAEPGIKAELSYDTVAGRRWVVKGGPVQELYDSIALEIEKCADKQQRIKTIEDFIEKDPLNVIGVELIRKYMVDIPQQDNQKIRSAIAKLSGIQQDNEFIAITKKKIEERSYHSSHKIFPSFTYFTADSNRNVTHNSYNRKHLLITFWASWDKPSLNRMKMLTKFREEIKSDNFAILNIALDHDTIAWKECVNKENFAGDNVCEQEAWNSEIAGKFDIGRLPYSILVNPYQRIIRYGIDLDKDLALIDSLVKKYDTEKKERERRDEQKKNRKNKR